MICLAGCAYTVPIRHDKEAAVFQARANVYRKPVGRPLRLGLFPQPRFRLRR